MVLLAMPYIKYDSMYSKIRWTKLHSCHSYEAEKCVLKYVWEAPFCLITLLAA